MKKIFLTIVTVSALSFMAAQSPAPPGRVYTSHPSYPGVTISGSIVDKSGVGPVSFATVIISQQGKEMTGVITDEHGEFKIGSLQPGDFDVEVKSMGYKPYKRKITSNEIRHERLSIQVFLQPEDRCICEVVIETQKEKQFKTNNGSQDIETGWAAEYMVRQSWGW